MATRKKKPARPVDEVLSLVNQQASTQPGVPFYEETEEQAAAAIKTQRQEVREATRIPTFGELFEESRRDPRDMTWGIIERVSGVNAAADQDDAAARKSGWVLDLKKYDNLPDEYREYIIENGTGPNALARAEMQVASFAELDDKRRRAGLMATLGASIGASGSDPLQFTAGALTGGIGYLGRVGVLASRGQKLTQAARAAQIVSWRGRLAEDLAAGVGLAAAQDTIGGQHLSAVDYAADTLFTTALHTTPQLIVAGGRAIASNVQRAADGSSVVGDTGLRGELSSRGLGEEPESGATPQGIADPEAALHEAALKPGPSHSLYTPEDLQRLNGEEPPTPEVPDAPETVPAEAPVDGELPRVEIPLDLAPARRPEDATSWDATGRPVADVSQRVQQILDGKALPSDDWFPGVESGFWAKVGSAVRSSKKQTTTTVDSRVDMEIHGESVRRVQQTIEKLAREFLPSWAKVSLVLTDQNLTKSGNDAGWATPSNNGAVIAVRLGNGREVTTAVHELGHALTYVYGKQLTNDEWKRLTDAWQRIASDPDPEVRVAGRWATTMTSEGRLPAAMEQAGDLSRPYVDRLGEMTAEQMVKYVAHRGEELGLSKTVQKTLARFMAALRALFTSARAQGMIDAESTFADFFDQVRPGGVYRQRAEAAGPNVVRTSDQNYAAGKQKAAALTASVDRQRAPIYERALAFLKANPTKTARLRTINRYLGGALSPGLRMAGSENAIVRYLAAKLVETTTGAAGRLNTAAVQWSMLQERYAGRMLPQFDAASKGWAKSKGTYSMRQILNGEARTAFSEQVSIELVARRNDPNYEPTDPHVRAAVEAVEAAGQRTLDDLKSTQVAGSGGLPESSRGYFPQELMGAKLAEASPEDKMRLRVALAEQFRTAFDWGVATQREIEKMSQAVADVYVRNAEAREHDLGVPTLNIMTGSAHEVRTALTAMGQAGGMPPDIALMVQQNVRGMKHTRGRLPVDIRDPFVRQFFNTDVLGLMRRYVHRSAAEVALHQIGIPGYPGLMDLRATAQTHGPTPTREERAAMDQVMNELMGAPVDGAVTSEPAQVLRTLTSAVRLGQVVWTQAAETMNVVHHLGAASAMRFIPALPRILADIRKARAGIPTGGILAGVDKWGSAPGLRDYNLKMPLDPAQDHLTSYTESPGMMATISRYVGHYSGVINFFRGFLAAQHRFVAEELVKRALQDADAGIAPTPLLQDTGITPELYAAIKSSGAVEKVDGRIVGVDLLKLRPEHRQTFLQAVHRGTAQMIQRNFVGENNMWEHNDYVKVLTQFRTFSITAVEKQWARQRGVAQEAGGAMDGYAAVAGRLLAQTAIGMLIYTARQHAQSVGREDRDAYLEKRLTPGAVIAGSLGMAPLAGYSPDAISALGSLKGWMPEGTDLGRGRAPGVGSLVPAAGVVDQALRVGTGRSKDPAYDLVRTLPGSNSPALLPLVNLLQGDGED